MRALVTFAVVAAALLGLVAACGSPPSSGQDPAARSAVEATAVRRTAVAAVQAVIANNQTATALPAATAMPRPTCDNAIWWTEADTNIGQARTVQGRVVAIRALPGGAQLLDVGAPYPDPTGFGIVVFGPPLAAPASALGTASDAGIAALAGKTVCVQGRILSSEGRPVMQLADATRIRVVD